MGELTVGEHTYGQSHISRRGVDNNVVIGKFCSIAINVVIDGGFNHNSKFVSTYPFKSNFNLDVPSNTVCKGDIVIGSDVWICENTLIMSGVKIGDGAIIGANSIITHDVNPYSIVAGNPSHIIRYRFKPSEIEELLKIKWWDWDIEKIKENGYLLNGGSIEDFINKHKI